jgi:hypothetical protein
VKFVVIILKLMASEGVPAQNVRSFMGLICGEGKTVTVAIPDEID